MPNLKEAGRFAVFLAMVSASLGVFALPLTSANAYPETPSAAPLRTSPQVPQVLNTLINKPINAPVSTSLTAPQNTPSDLPQGVWLHVESATQQLHVRAHTTTVTTYPISTSKYGLGEVANSYRTPRGWHYVRARIGEGAPLGTVFVGRQHTGRTATIHTDATDTADDLIVSRILWLSGLEAGQNKGINNGTSVDSFARYIYIHGTDEEGLIGTPASHGCVRMRNADVMALFEQIPLYTLVLIE